MNTAEIQSALKILSDTYNGYCFSALLNYGIHIYALVFVRVISNNVCFLLHEMHEISIV